VTLSHDSHRSSWLPGGGSTPMSRWGCSELRPADRPRSHQAGHPAGHTHAAGGGLNAVMTVTTPPGSPVGLDHLVELLLHGVLPFAAVLRSLLRAVEGHQHRGGVVVLPGIAGSMSKTNAQVPAWCGVVSS